MQKYFFPLLLLPCFLTTTFSCEYEETEDDKRMREVLFKASSPTLNLILNSLPEARGAWEHDGLKLTEETMFFKEIVYGLTDEQLIKFNERGATIWGDLPKNEWVKIFRAFSGILRSFNKLESTAPVVMTFADALPDAFSSFSAPERCAIISETMGMTGEQIQEFISLRKTLSDNLDRWTVPDVSLSCGKTSQEKIDLLKFCISKTDHVRLMGSASLKMFIQMMVGLNPAEREELYSLTCTMCEGALERHWDQIFINLSFAKAPAERMNIARNVYDKMSDIHPKERGPHIFSQIKDKPYIYRA